MIQFLIGGGVIVEPEAQLEGVPRPRRHEVHSFWHDPYEPHRRFSVTSPSLPVLSRKD
jgi:hypothetical protein